jgi:hypothetical protein
MSDVWLPEHLHHGLWIEHNELEGAGSFTGGGWKFCWHITVSPWESVDAMYRVLKDKNAAPHFVIGGRANQSQPVVIQMLPLDEAGRSLQHTLPEETNRANVIQVEICATPESIARFHHYPALANLARMVHYRIPEISPRQARSFQNTKRFTGQGFVNAKGHLGHMHVPGNDHFDPTTAFKGAKLMRLIKSGPHELGGAHG